MPVSDKNGKLQRINQLYHFTAITMSYLKYPSREDYELPKKNVLVISCMDLRLTDDLMAFLNFDNLENRYDHFILAGASLLCSPKLKKFFASGCYEQYSNWKQVQVDHLNLAIALHNIKDVYIVEHENCGAYSSFLDQQHTEVDLSTLKHEKKTHKKFASTLAREIHDEVRSEINREGEMERYQLGVHSFFIDLRGNVEVLDTLRAKKLH